MSSDERPEPADRDVLRSTLLSTEKALSESELALRQIVASAPFGAHIYRLEDDGRLILTRTNAAADRILGIDHAPLLGKTIEEAFPGLVGTAIPSIYRDIAAQRTTYSQEHVDYDEGAIRGAFDITAFPTAPRHMAVFFQDITERKRTQAALTEEAARRRILFEQSPDGIVIIEPETGAFLEFNAAAHRQLGYSREEFARLGVTDVEANENAEEVRERIGRVIREGQSDFETLHRTKQGELRPIHVTLQMVDVLGRPVFHCILRDITERRRVDLALRKSEQRFRLIFENSTAGVALVAPDGRYLMVNPAFSEIFGYSAAEFPGVDFLTVTHPDDAELSRQIMLKVLEANGEPVRFTKRYLHKDGHTIWAELSSALVVAEDGSPSYFITHLTDITERTRASEDREKLQAQLAQAQKMESVGRLAGGVAHDFNNMLGVILGHAEMALERLDRADPLHADLEEIRQAAQRSADLTRQLLAFARRQTVAPRVLDLNDTIAGMLRMLRRLIGEDIDLTWLPHHGLCPVKIDPTQLDQILANLCVNARDAIEGVGKVTIQTKNIELDADYCAAVTGLSAGEYVVLTVSDNGAGMERDVLDHLFEPFYTTKALGRGTGLGLATVYGIVRQNDGVIHAYSEPGIGTTFNVYLPRFSGQPVKWTDVGATEAWRAGGETVLLVEDEPAMLNLGKAMLERLGLAVLTAGGPADAVRLAEAHPGRIDLLITDVVMPGMNGRDLASRIGAVMPGLACVFMSGYTADIIAHRGVLDADVRFLQKPFSTRDLATKVREALESGRRS
jgi:two-component system, cell cycle sensor histidine kinase and response regulator CckA